MLRRIAILLVGLLIVGCEPVRAPVGPQSSSENGQIQSGTDGLPAVSDDVPAPLPATSDTDAIRIASYNIQVFGVSKLGKPEVMAILADVVRRFDVVAIQEIRSADQTVLPQFIQMVNSTGRQYSYVLGPRLGRTSSKEQYAFVYDTEKIELFPDSVHTVDDPQDLLHREPLVARFRVRGPPAEQAFTFTLANIHTDPDETDTELDALAEVFRRVKDSRVDDDLILLGDLNVDEQHLGLLGQVEGIRYVIAGQTTNTRRDKSYDNIVFSAPDTTEFTGGYGVLDLMAEYGLSEEAALKVSDHFPVWAEFRARESHCRPIATAENAPQDPRLH